MKIGTILSNRFLSRCGSCFRLSLIFSYLGIGSVKLRGADVLDHWTKRSSEQAWKVEFAGGVFFAFPGGGRLITSTNGSDWIFRETGVTNELTGVAYGPVLEAPFASNGYILVGFGGTILSSHNAIDWVRRTSPVTNDFRGIASSGSRFCVIFDQRVANDPNALFSFDGINWTTSSFPDLSQLPFPPLGSPYRTVWILPVGSGFLVGASSSIVQDVWQFFPGAGGGWRLNTLRTVYDGAAEGNGRIVVLDHYVGASVSKNSGTNWTSLTATNTGGSWPGMNTLGNCLAFGNGLFVAGPGLLTSVDGETWNRRAHPFEGYVSDICFGQGTFVVATSQGIYQSAEVSKPYVGAKRIPDGDKVRLTVSGEVGRPYRLQSSTNLTTWMDRNWFTNSTFSADLTNSVGAGTNQIFFRVVSP